MRNSGRVGHAADPSVHHREIACQDERIGMSTSSVERTSPSGQGTSGRGATGQLATAQGKTTIAESVVEKIAGIAARQVSGVYGLGGGRNLLRGALQAEN